MSNDDTVTCEHYIKFLAKLAAGDVDRTATVVEIEREWIEPHSIHGAEYDDWVKQKENEFEDVEMEYSSSQTEGSSQEYFPDSQPMASSQPMSDQVLEDEVQAEKRIPTPDDQTTVFHELRLNQFLPEFRPVLQGILDRVIRKRGTVPFGWCELVDMQTNKSTKDKYLPLESKVGYIQLSHEGSNHVCILTALESGWLTLV